MTKQTKLQTRINELEAKKAEKVKYVSVWLFDHSVEIDNPLDQGALTVKMRQELFLIRRLNYQIQALKDLQ